MVDLYQLDYQFQKSEVIDNYESLVWTDRWRGAGDFKLVMRDKHTLAHRLASTPSYLMMSESNRIMMVESVDIPSQSDENEGSVVTVTGRSIEAFLYNRSSKSYSGKDPEQVTGSPGGIVKWVVDRYCVNGATAGVPNVIPGLAVTSTTTGAAVTLQVERGIIYDVINPIAEAYGIGWAIFKGSTPGALNMLIQDPVDRTTDPMSSAYRIYSADSDNLLKTSSLESIANFKNNARVIGAKTQKDVFLAPYTASISGFERRTMHVDALDVGGPEQGTTVAQDQIVLEYRGQRALRENNNRYFKMVDGEIPPHQWNKTYYGLGDIVFLKDLFGTKVKMQINESIYTSDAQGDRYAPSFEALETT